MGINAAPTIDNYLVLNDTKIGIAPSVLLQANQPQGTGGTINNPLRLVASNADNNIGLDVEVNSTGALTNTGLRVNINGGNNRHAAVFTGGRVGIGTNMPNADLHVMGSESKRVSSYGGSTSYGVNDQDNIILHTAGPTASFFLPDANAHNGRVIYYKKTGTGYGVEFVAFSGQQVEGSTSWAPSFGFADRYSLMLIAGNGNWWVLNLSRNN